MSRYPAGSVRLRVFCPRCHRSIATTGNKLGDRWLRPHVSRPGEVCIRVGQSYQVKHLDTHHGIRVNLDELVNQ